MGMKPVTYSVEVNGSLCIREPINFYTEDRGWITGNGTKTYAPDGTLVVTVMTEKRKTEDETAGIQPKDFPKGCWVEFAADHIWSPWKKLWEFTAYWECPGSPPEPHSNTVNLLFNAVQDYSEPVGIAQPMLEWNNWPGHPNRWSGVASFIDEDGHDFWSPTINVDEGDRVKGELNWQISGWKVCFSNLDTGITTCIGYSDVDDNDIFIFTALEAFNVYNYKDVPGHTTFHDMSFIDNYGNPYDIEWEPFINQTAQQILPCLDVDVVSDSKVKLFTPVCGDVNGDGNVIPAYDGPKIFAGNITTCNWAADVDCSGVVVPAYDGPKIFAGSLNCCEPGCPAP